jgi:hypothetical protein
MDALLRTANWRRSHVLQANLAVHAEFTSKSAGQMRNFRAKKRSDSVAPRRRMNGGVVGGSGYLVSVASTFTRTAFVDILR